MTTNQIAAIQISHEIWIAIKKIICASGQYPNH